MRGGIYHETVSAYFVSVPVGDTDWIVDSGTAPADQKLFFRQVELLYLAARHYTAAAAISL